MYRDENLMIVYAAVSWQLSFSQVVRSIGTKTATVSLVYGHAPQHDAASGHMVEAGTCERDEHWDTAMGHYNYILYKGASHLMHPSPAGIRATKPPGC